jgi:small conductance mechanosensitive channel
MIRALLFQNSGSSNSAPVDPSAVSAWDIAVAALVAVLAIPIGSIVSRITIKALRRVPNLPETIIEDLGRLVRWLVYLIAFALALTLLGVTVGWLSIVVVVIIILGVLMVKPMVENIAAGLLMTLRPSFSVGDQIQTDDYRGTVREIGSRTTVLDTSNGVSIHIPNVEAADKVIEVYTAHDTRKSSVSFSVGFTTNLDDLTKRLMRAMDAINIVESDPAPSIQASGFDDSPIALKVGFWYASSHSSDSDATDAVVRSIQSTLSDAGITPVTHQIIIERSNTEISATSAKVSTESEPISDAGSSPQTDTKAADMGSSNPDDASQDST